MGLRPLLSLPAVVLSSLAGCSIIYNPDNLPPLTDAEEIDAPIDAPIDSNPELLEITDVSPSSIFEGMGAGGSRPVVLTLNGTAIVGDAQVSVELMGSAAPATLVDFDAVPDGTQGGVIVRIPVMTDLPAGMSRTLRITITQGTVTKMADVTVHGLDELTLVTSPVATTVNAPIYSTITVMNNVHFTGSEPVILQATASIDVMAALDANASGRTAGPHGCDGGVMEQQGGCAAGGGKQGVNGAVLMLGAGSGGGGGGFGGLGTSGGADGGDPGMPTGNDALVPIITSPGAAGNRGNGGGGGGGTLTGMGGPGGGGGGVVWLEAGGDIVVGAMGSIESRGGTTNGGSGGGGGGSGGAILVRAGGMIMSTTRWLSAPGGLASTGSTNPGGPGSAGRIRVDTPMGDIASMANNPTAFRGPSWALATPSLTTTSPATFTFHGQPGRAFDLRLNDQALAQTATPGSNGSVEVTGVVLRPGTNLLCGVALSGQIQTPESRSCVELFYAGN